MKKFILFGAAGYIAERHMQAIAENGGDLVAIIDPHDSVGVIDRYFPDCEYYRSIDNVLVNANSIDYAVICTPNNTHIDILKWCNIHGIDAICEKPLIIPQQYNAFKKVDWKIQIHPILQMRLHMGVDIVKSLLTDFNSIEINYSTPRGQWYFQSWKNYVKCSGGLHINIGIHLFDLLFWLLGTPGNLTTTTYLPPDEYKAACIWEHSKAKIDLSIQAGHRERTFKVNGYDVDFTEGFESLHTEMYDRIIKGNGFTVDDALTAIKYFA